jgi:hypothetical protein
MLGDADARRGWRWIRRAHGCLPSPTARAKHRTDAGVAHYRSAINLAGQPLLAKIAAGSAVHLERIGLSTR